MPGDEADGLRAAEEKMRAGGQPEEAIRAFRRAYERLAGGERRCSRAPSSSPRATFRRSTTLPEADAGGRARARRRRQAQRRPRDDDGAATARSRSSKRARGSRSSTSSSARPCRCAAGYGVRLPLVLMDSEATQRETLEALAGHRSSTGEPAADFLQSMIPKLEADTLAPVSWPRGAGARMVSARSRRRLRRAARARACWRRCSSAAFATR